MGDVGRRRRVRLFFRTDGRGPGKSLGLMFDRNWLRRDCRIKQALGFEQDYWHRAATVLRLERSAGVSPVS